MPKKCPNCSENNADSNRFCESCGAKMALPQENAIGSTSSAPQESPASSAALAIDATTEKKKPAAPKKTAAAAVQAKGSVSSELKPAGLVVKELFTRFKSEEVLYAILVIIAIISRFYDLGYKPLHHDESIHALNSFNLLKGSGYQYDPGYHGPLLYHLNALVYFLFGATDYTARIAPAFFGVVLIIIPYFMRDMMGKTAAFLLSLLFTISPTFLYVSRFIRHDTYLVFTTLAMVILYFRFVKEPKPVYAYLFALVLAISFCSLENTYLHVTILFPFLAAQFLWDANLQPGGFKKIAAQYNLAFWKSWEEDKKYLTSGVMLLVFILGWALLVKPNWDGALNDLRNYVQVANQKNTNQGLTYQVVKALAENPGMAIWFIRLLVPGLIGGTFFGLAWYTKSFKTSFICYAVFFAVFLPLFTTMIFGNSRGLFDGFVRSVTYWLAQQKVSRGDQPWFYYYGLLLLYELCMVFFTFIGFIVFTFFKRTFFTTFTLYWVIGTFIAYVTAAEKMPWITIHMLLPMTVLSALTVAYFLEHPFMLLRRVVLVPFVFLATLLIHNAILLAYYNPANPVEPMVYVQSTNDIKQDIMPTIDRLSNRLEGGKNMFVTCEDLCAWPFAWYLRDYKKLDYPNPVTRIGVMEKNKMVAPLDRPVVLSAWQHGQTGGDEHDKAAEDLLGKTYHEQKYQLRAWWDWTNTWKEGNMDMGKYWRWLLYRETWSTMGSQDMIFWIRNDVWEQSQ